MLRLLLGGDQRWSQLTHPRLEMKPTLTSAVLAVGAVMLGLCAGSYARWANQANSAKDAAAFALPFMLFSTAAASSAAMALVASIDAAAQQSRRQIKP